mmetsp:Transcript_5520/g.9815  ORF Transcript_5520/g.9815 Transcript_5520/m.9815 type:complete len:385 (-) Transcript_5520:61-1215(-)
MAAFAFTSAVSASTWNQTRPLSITRHQKRHQTCSTRRARLVCSSSIPVTPIKSEKAQLELAIRDADIDKIQSLLRSNPDIEMQQQDAFKMLDLCANKFKPEDSVFSNFAYKILTEKSLLTSFGSVTQFPVEEKNVAPEQIQQLAGVPMESLSPKRSTLFSWQLGGIVTCLGILGLSQWLHFDPKPMALGVTLFFLWDNLILGGVLLESAYSNLFPAYKDKVTRHEAGHFLASYLLGLPVRGIILDSLSALKTGIAGASAGTVFSSEDLETSFAKGQFRSDVLDKYSIVLMAGIAAEAMYYGQAEGGKSDEAMLINLLMSLSPPWEEGKIRAYARFCALNALLLLKRNQKALDALFLVLKEKRGQSLGECIEAIETNAVDKRVAV